MIALLLSLLLMQPAPPAAEVKEDPEIIVLAKRLSEVQMAFRAERKDGRTVLAKCEITRSSGDPEIDAIPCKATEACIALQHAKSDDLVACVRKEGRKQVRTVADARRQERAAQ